MIPLSPLQQQQTCPKAQLHPLQMELSAGLFVVVCVGTQFTKTAFPLGCTGNKKVKKLICKNECFGFLNRRYLFLLQGAFVSSDFWIKTLLTPLTHLLRDECNVRIAVSFQGNLPKSCLSSRDWKTSPALTRPARGSSWNQDFLKARDVFCPQPHTSVLSPMQPSLQVPLASSSVRMLPETSQD